MLNQDVADLPDTPRFSAADRPFAALHEVQHRQSQQPSRDVVETSRVDAYGGERQQIPLRHERRHDEGHHAAHRDDQESQEREILLDQHAIDDDLREDRQHQLEDADDHRQPECRAINARCGLTIGHSQASPRAAVGACSEGRGVIEKRRVAGPATLELIATEPPLFPTPGRPDRRRRRVTCESTSQWSPSQWQIAGSGIRGRDWPARS